MPITVPPKIFPGRAHKDNKGAIDWGRQNLLAYGCHSYIVVLDPSSQSIVQTLDEHRSPVVSVKWCPDNIVSDLDKPSKLRLASGDKTGSIIIWNVLEATIITTITEPTLKSVLDMKWIVRNDTYYLLVLYSPSALVLWNINTNSKIWRLDFNDPLSWFELNPFDTTHLILASNSGLIYFINDFTLENKKPVQVELKYTISSNRSSNKNNSDFQQVIFSPAARNVCYFLLSREIIIFDLTIHQAIGSLVLDRSRGSFTNLLTFQEEPNLFICVHEDATLSAWFRKKSEFKFELECYSDIIRFNKHSKKKGLNIVSICNNPNKESLISSITNDGSIWIWEYMYNNPSKSIITSPSSSSSSSWVSNKEQKFGVISLIEHISSSISSLCVSPFTEDNESLIALGSYHGTIQIIDMLKSVTSYEFLLWNQPVRGVRWASPNTLMAFNCEEVSKSEFKNRLTILDIKTGKQQEIRKVNGTENTFIRAVRISSSRQYFIVLLKDKPFELWDLKSLSLLRTMKPFSQITSLEWAPMKGEATSTSAAKEQFVFTLPDGSIRYFSVFNGIVTPIEMTADLGMGVISSLAWKDDILVSGDTVGTLHVWNLATKKSSAYATNKGLIRRIRFAPTSKQIIVLYNEGDIAIWDLEHGVRLAVSNYLKGRDLKAIDCDWITDNTPIVATTDGCVRILDRSLSTSNYNYLFKNDNIPVFTPYLLPYSQALNIKVVLQHLLTDSNVSYSPTISDKNTTTSTTMSFNEESLLKYVDPAVVTSINSKNSIQSKCLEVAKYFGNVEESQFWTLVQFSFEKFQHKKGALNSHNIPTPNTSNDSLDLNNISSQTIPESGTTIVTNNTNNGSSDATRALPLYFDLLLDNEVIRKMELDRALIQETKKSGYELTKKIADFNILLGQKTKAIDLLLETPRDNPNFYRDALKAAVIAATVSPDTFKNTIKLLATDFIANGNIDEGVQLLCIIGKSFDACRHLQTYDRFTDSVWLAKISLSESESFQIMKSWSNFLTMTNHKMKAINILVTLGEFEQVIRSLYDSKMVELAALFVQACLSEGYLSIQLENKSEQLTPFEQIVQSIYLDYGLYLHRLGNNKAAEYYWKQAGPSGATILETKRNSTKTTSQ